MIRAFAQFLFIASHGCPNQVELLFSLQLTSMDSYTLPVGIAKFVGAMSVDWGKSSAAASITMVPIILVGFIMQRYLVAGLTAGAVKE
jgi:multiple sugar transport system permease protein